MDLDLLRSTSISLAKLPGSAVAPDVINRLESVGTILLKDVSIDDDNTQLLALARAIGEPSKVALRGAREHKMLIEQDVVHRVEELATPLRNSVGAAVVSTTAEAFPCHTDEYFEERPSEVVILLCVQAARVGGETTLAHVDDVLARLPVERRETLSLPLFPHRSGLVSLLVWSGTKAKIRFNRQEIESYYLAAGAVLPAFLRDALDDLTLAIENNTVVLTLAAGECLVLNNMRVLHGRRPFTSGSGRLFKRVRVRHAR